MLRSLGRMANSVLDRFGLEIVRKATDMDCLLAEGPRRDALFRQSATAARTWLENTRTFQWVPFDVETEIRVFFDNYMLSPTFRDSRGGSRFGNLLWLDLLAKAFAPDLIIDSGTFKGASAWALQRGCPNALVLSFDIDLSQAVRIGGVEYIASDWTQHPLPDGAKIMAYFDDHTDQCARVQQSWERGVTVAVFDDDYTVAEMPPMAHGGFSLPKLSFAFDDTIADGEAIEWYEGPRRYSWTADKKALDAARTRVSHYERLCDIGAPFGIEQIPYSIAAIAPR